MQSLGQGCFLQVYCRIPLVYNRDKGRQVEGLREQCLARMIVAGGWLPCDRTHGHKLVLGSNAIVC